MRINQKDEINKLEEIKFNNNYAILYSTKETEKQNQFSLMTGSSLSHLVNDFLHQYLLIENGGKTFIDQIFKFKIMQKIHNMWTIIDDKNERRYRKTGNYLLINLDATPAEKIRFFTLYEAILYLIQTKTTKYRILQNQPINLIYKIQPNDGYILRIIIESYI